RGPAGADIWKANVDGIDTEWDLTNDFFANLYVDGDTSKPLLATLYLRYDCVTKILYSLVVPVQGMSIHTGDANFFNKGTATAVKSSTGDDDVPPDFHYVQQNGTAAAAWEASFKMTNPQDATIFVQAGINNPINPNQNIATVSPRTGIELKVVCGP